MEPSLDQAVYQQIADNLCERILAGEWKEGERFPSVRELAESNRVNPNVVTRSCGWLEVRGIIQAQAGRGYVVSPEARQRTLELKRRALVARELPRVFRTMDLVGMNCEEMARRYAERNVAKEELA